MMKAVILAAGAARRLESYTNNTPKCLIEIGEKSILEYQLEALNRHAVDEVVIVVGYLQEQIRGKFGGNYKNLKISYVENPWYARTNTIYSLYLAREYFTGNDFLYFNGDVLFHPEMLTRLVESSLPSVLAVERKLCGQEEVKVVIDEKERVLEIGKEIAPQEAVGEFIGIARFSARLSKTLTDDLEHYIKEGEKTAFFEKALNLTLKMHDVYMVDISDLPGIEIDFPEDLLRAREEILPKIRKDIPIKNGE